MARHRYIAVVTTFVLMFAAPLRGEVKVLKNFTLIDGTGRPPAASSAMIVDNGRVTWVGPSAQLKPPAVAETVDLTGKFVMPGIINLHGHVGNTVDLQQDAKFYTRDNVQKNLATYASYGVTTVLSLGTDQDLIFKIRAEQRAGRPSVTRVYAAGQGFVFKGGYGGLEWRSRSCPRPKRTRLSGSGEKGVDIIKLWTDDHLGARRRCRTHSQSHVDGAHKRNLPVAAHIFYLEDAKQLVEYGVNGLAHSVRDKNVDASLIAAMKKHGTWQLAATLTREASMFIYAKTPDFVGDPFFTRGVSLGAMETLKSATYQKSIASDPHFDKYRDFFDTAKRNLKVLADAGVRYGFGTDTGPPGRFPGYFEQWELELMAQAGLTPMQVIVAATGNAAQFLNTKELGTLEPGRWADLVVLDRNPLQDIRNTRAINAVIAGTGYTKAGSCGTPHTTPGSYRYDVFPSSPLFSSRFTYVRSSSKLCQPIYISSPLSNLGARRQPCKRRVSELLGGKRNVDDEKENQRLRTRRGGFRISGGRDHDDRGSCDDGTNRRWCHLGRHREGRIRLERRASQRDGRQYRDRLRDDNYHDGRRRLLRSVSDPWRLPGVRKGAGLQGIRSRGPHTPVRRSPPRGYRTRGRRRDG